MCVFILVLCCSDYCSFVVLFGIRERDTPHVVLSEDCCGYSALLWFHTGRQGVQGGPSPGTAQQDCQWTRQRLAFGEAVVTGICEAGFQTGGCYPQFRGSAELSLKSLICACVE